MTKQELLAEAYRWLDKAVAYEAEGKPAKFVEMAFNKALDFERKAFAL